MENNIVIFDGIEFKWIKGFEGRYGVSKCAKVVSVSRHKHRYLGTHKTYNGYDRVELNNNYKFKRVRLHRLVAIHWLPNKWSLPQVHHKDHNRNNNHFDNLEWVTQKQNLMYRTIKMQQDKINLLSIGVKETNKNKENENEDKEM